MLRCILPLACLLAAVSGAAVTHASEERNWEAPHSLEAEASAEVSLIPFPRSVHWQPGKLHVAGKGLQLLGNVQGTMIQTAFADYAAVHTAGTAGLLHVQCNLKADAVPVEHAAEGYHLTIGEKGVLIEAASETGLFNGFQTLRQMLSTGKGFLPYCRISDWPAFRYRGYMQDCGRNFRSVERLKKEIALAAQLKVNLFHWHLTDYPAWHVQCKSHPRLNAPQFRTRDRYDTYSYEQIREVFEYAAARNITIIPELDMPGHSAYFDRAFGFKMHSPEGMKVVGELLDEFCREIPASICPIIHFGADEVRIPNAAEFVSFVSQKLMSHGRTPMQWASHRDLPVGSDSIEQRWGEGLDYVAKSMSSESITRRAFDSTMGYSNLLDPALLVRRYFFMRPCGSAKGDKHRLGPIFCIWPDGKVDNKDLIPGMCTMWPGMMAMAERAWLGGGADGDHFPLEMTAWNTRSTQAYRMFELRMKSLADTLFQGEAFPHWIETNVEWTLVEPVPTQQASGVREKVLSGDYEGLSTRKAYCANLYFRTRPDTGYLGIFANTRPGHTVWAITTIRAEQAGKQKFMLGFDAPARSNRRWTGVPQAGEWTQCGTRIWLNGKELSNPRQYRLAGQRRHPGNAWNFELPLDPEEIWWIQDPIEIELKEGENIFMIEHPYVGEHQSWGISLIPLGK